MERESFVFYRSFYEAIKCLNDETAGKVMKAICDYGLDGTEQELSGVEKAMFLLIKPQIDANNKRFENGKLGAEYGKLGGRPKKDNPTETPKKPLDNPTETPNVNVNVNVNDNNNVNVKQLVRDFNLQQCSSISAFSMYLNKPERRDCLDAQQVTNLMSTVKEAFRNKDDMRDIQMMVQTSLDNLFMQRGQTFKKEEPKQEKKDERIYYRNLKDDPEYQEFISGNKPKGLVSIKELVNNERR